MKLTNDFEDDELQYGHAIGYRENSKIIISEIHHTYAAAKTRYDELKKFGSRDYSMFRVSETIPMEELKFLTTIEVNDYRGRMRITRLFDSQEESYEWAARMKAKSHITKALAKDDYQKWLTKK